MEYRISGGVAGAGASSRCLGLLSRSKFESVNLSLPYRTRLSASAALPPNIATLIELSASVEYGPSLSAEVRSHSHAKSC